MVLWCSSWKTLLWGILMGLESAGLWNVSLFKSQLNRQNKGDEALKKLNGNDVAIRNWPQRAMIPSCSFSRGWRKCKGNLSSLNLNCLSSQCWPLRDVRPVAAWRYHLSPKGERKAPTSVAFPVPLHENQLIGVQAWESAGYRESRKRTRSISGHRCLGWSLGRHIPVTWKSARLLSRWRCQSSTAHGLAST